MILVGSGHGGGGRHGGGGVVMIGGCLAVKRGTKIREAGTWMNRGVIDNL